MIRTAFLCHHQQWDQEVHKLADELRLRGVAPWVDVQGGFKVGDHTPSMARRAIVKESFATLIYATPGIFDRPFVREEEVPAALEAWEADPRYLLSVIARAQSYRDIAAASLEAVKRDLTPFVGRKAPGDERERQLAFGVIGRELLDQYLDRFAPPQPDAIPFQFSTRDLLGDEPDDLLRVDATHVVTDVTDEAQWLRVQRGLLDVKAVLSQQFGRVPLRVHGSKHLTAAYLLGATFPSTTFAISIKTKGGDWLSGVTPIPFPLDRVSIENNTSSGILFLELEIIGQPTEGPVDEAISRTGTIPQIRTRLKKASGNTAMVLTNGHAIDIAEQVRAEILATIRRQSGLREVHLFGAVPQGLAMLIGHRTNALPPIQLYEFVDRAYKPSYRINLQDDLAQERDNR